MAKFCRYCGNPVREDVKFCPKCGKPQVQAAQQAASQQSSQRQQEPIHPESQPIRQAAQTVLGQAAQPMQQTSGFAGGITNGLNAPATPGETALEIPGLRLAADAAKNGGLPGIARALIPVAAGGISIPVLYQLDAPWSFLTGAGVSFLLIFLSSVFKKSGGGGK